MIEVRVRFTDQDGTYWTAPIRNRQALDKLLAAHRERNIPTDVFDDEATATLADECFRAADRGQRGTARGSISWGPAGRVHVFACDIAKEPPELRQDAEAFLVPADCEASDDAAVDDALVVGGFPLLDAAPPEGWEERVAWCEVRPRPWWARLAAGLAWLLAPTIPRGGE
jgi:hypothetical protein